MSPGTGTHAGLKGGRLQSPGRRPVGGSAQSSAAGLGWRRRRGHSWPPAWKSGSNITHTNEGEDEGEDVDQPWTWTRTWTRTDVWTWSRRRQAEAEAEAGLRRGRTGRVDGRLARLNRARARAWTVGRSLLPHRSLMNDGFGLD
jgi:hypothetical protein